MRHSAALLWVPVVIDWSPDLRRAAVVGSEAAWQTPHGNVRPMRIVAVEPSQRV
jgi:hypothetical protein